MPAASEHDVYSFEPFTRHRFYDDVNRALAEEGIRRLPSPSAAGRTIVDLSCGTGAMTLMVIEALRSRGLDATVIGVEPSSDALARAESRVAGAGLGCASRNRSTASCWAARAKGLLDELDLFVNPTALGGGMPVFANLDAYQQLRLVAAQPFDCGITALHFEPKRS